MNCTPSIVVSGLLVSVLVCPAFAQGELPFDPPEPPAELLRLAPVDGTFRVRSVRYDARGNEAGVREFHVVATRKVFGHALAVDMWSGTSDRTMQTSLIVYRDSALLEMTVSANGFVELWDQVDAWPDQTVALQLRGKARFVPDGPTSEPLLFRKAFRRVSDEGYELAYHVSGDDGATWRLLFLETATRMAASQARVPPRSQDLGEDSLGLQRLPEVVKVGNGDRTLLLIPCMSCRWRAFDEFLAQNSHRYTAYAVTLPGIGGTPRPRLTVDGDRPVWQENAVRAITHLLDSLDLRDVIVVGSSFGGVVGLQVAAQRPGRMRAFVNLDGPILKPTTGPTAPGERLAAARAVAATWAPRLQDAEYWAEFNARGIKDIPDPERRLMYFGMFMATDRVSLLQYWRENVLVDLGSVLRNMAVRTLDVRAIEPGTPDPDEIRRQYLSDLRSVGASDNVRPIFMYDTSHFIVEHRPEALVELLERLFEEQPVDD